MGMTSVIPLPEERKRELENHTFIWYVYYPPGGSSSVVERHVANVDVAGSNPVSRSIK